MHIQYKILTALFLLFFTLSSYAIQVNVRSSSSNITGLGFSVNGSNYGGLGRNYFKKDAPTGTYSFGLRSNGKDVSCGKTVTLKRDSVAILHFNGNTCTASIMPMGT